MKKITSIILVMLFLLTQTLNCFAAITNFKCSVISNTNGATTVKASITSDVYSDLEDGKASVTYAVYRDGNPITDFILPTNAISTISSVSDGVYKRDYEYVINRADYSDNIGVYSTVAKAVYDNSCQTVTRELEIFDIPINGVTLNQTNLFMQIGDSSQISAKVSVSGINDNSVSWSSSNTNVATVDNLGTINAAGEGTAKIKATSVTDSVYSAECMVYVVNKKTSADEVTWNTVVTGRRGSYNKVTYGNGMFVIVNDDLIYSSSDGVNWKSRFDLLGMSTFNDVAWSGNLFVVVENRGCILTSVDGIKWVERSLQKDVKLTSVIWDGKQFVAVGSLGEIMISSDGIKWVSRNTTNIGLYNTVNWNGNKYTALGWSNFVGDGWISLSYSYDGIKWIWHLRPEDNVEVTSVAWDGNKFVAVGGQSVPLSNTKKGVVFVSQDGLTWNIKYEVSDNMLMDILWDGKNFTAVGNKGTILISSDGITWHQKESGTTETLNGIAWDGTRYVITGSNGTILVSKPCINATAITLNKTALNLQVNQTEQLSATILPEDASNKEVRWSYRDIGVVDVSSTGLVTGIGTGTTVVRAASVDDPSIYVECTVTVTSSNQTPTSPHSGSIGSPIFQNTYIRKDGSTVKIEPPSPTLETNTKNAKVSISTNTLNSALSQAVEDKDGIKSIAIDIPKVDETKSYEVALPSDILSSENANYKFEVKTEFGTLLIPSNMLKQADIENAPSVSLVIKQADTTALSDETKAAVGEHPVVELNMISDGKVIPWNNAETPVLVSIPYKPTADEAENNEYIVVWYIDGNGNTIPVPNGRYDKNTGSVNFTTPHFSKYAVSYVHKTFEDIGNYGWAQNQIEVLASKDIIKGVSNKEYNPSSNITRADFLLLLVKTLGINTSSDSNFSDVDKADYYYDAVGIGKKLGIIDGVGDNKFNPNESISRQDMMTMCVRALNLSGKIDSTEKTSGLEEYTDKSLVASYAVDSIAMLVSQELVQGNGQNLNPLGNATRAEVAVLMYRIYNKFTL